MFKFIQKIKDYFNKDEIEKQKLIEELRELNEETNPEAVDYSFFPDVEIIDNGKDKNLFILDDIEETWHIYDYANNKLKNDYKLDINDYNIIKCFGKTAGFMAYKFLKLNGKKMDIHAAALDLTLGFGIKLKNGEFVDFDGIDIALILDEMYPECNFAFFTAHSMNFEQNSTLKQFKYKFEKNIKNSKCKIEDLYFTKDETIVEGLNYILQDKKC